MAEKKKRKAKSSMGTRLLKVFLLLFLLLVLAIGGFVLGVYLQLVDLIEVGKAVGVRQIPVVGEQIAEQLGLPLEEEVEELAEETAEKEEGAKPPAPDAAKERRRTGKRSRSSPKPSC